MQAVSGQRSATARVIIFPTRMSAQASLPPQDSGQPPSGYDPQKHGNWAQWIAPSVALLIGIALIVSASHSRKVDATAKAADEHTTNLINNQLNPAIEKINNSIDAKLAPITKKLDDLAEKAIDAQGQLKRLGSQQKQNIKRLRENEALADIRGEPEKILDTIRAQIQLAQKSKETLPYGKLVNYKLAVRALSPSVVDYWKTAAAIINYESWQNQLNGRAPDPNKVSKPCLTREQGMSTIWIIGSTFEQCIVDLDTNAFQQVTFKDSVIRYRGGATVLSGVTFINCSFILDLPSDKIPPNPARQIIFTLLDSPNQRVVKVTTHS
jgi:hypothetical protein